MYALHSVIWCNTQGCKSLLSIGGDNLQFCPIFNIGMDEPQTQFVSGEQINWRPKKRSSPKLEHFIKNRTNFIPRIHVETCAQKHARVKLLEGIEKKAILKLLGGYKVKLLGDISPIPRGFPHPWQHSKLALDYSFCCWEVDDSVAVSIDARRSLYLFWEERG